MTNLSLCEQALIENSSTEANFVPTLTLKQKTGIAASEIFLYRFEFLGKDREQELDKDYAKAKKMVKDWNVLCHEVHRNIDNFKQTLSEIEGYEIAAHCPLCPYTRIIVEAYRQRLYSIRDSCRSDFDKRIEICDLFHQMYSELSEIWTFLGVDEEGTSFGRRQKHVTQDEHVEIVRLRKEGMSMGKIANFMKRSSATIQNELGKHKELLSHNGSCRICGNITGEIQK